MVAQGHATSLLMGPAMPSQWQTAQTAPGLSSSASSSRRLSSPILRWEATGCMCWPPRQLRHRTTSTSGRVVPSSFLLNRRFKPGLTPLWACVCGSRRPRQIRQTDQASAHTQGRLCADMLVTVPHSGCVSLCKWLQEPPYAAITALTDHSCVQLLNNQLMCSEQLSQLLNNQPDR